MEAAGSRWADGSEQCPGLDALRSVPTLATAELSPPGRKWERARGAGGASQHRAWLTWTRLAEAWGNRI